MMRVGYFLLNTWMHFGKMKGVKLNARAKGKNVLETYQ